jgi:hypothetical protein
MRRDATVGPTLAAALESHIKFAFVAHANTTRRKMSANSGDATTATAI